MADNRKRRFMGNSEEPSGRKKFDQENSPGHRFLIPSKAAGAMIGKGGEIIKRLRTEYNCRIIIPDSQGPERLVIIDANPSTVIDIWSDILPSIQEFMNAKECDFKTSGKQIENDDEIDLRLLVHESQVGAVIGKGGERIRSLIDKHQMTMIKLYQAFCPNSTDRIVRMVSDIGNVMVCLGSIFRLLENQTIKGVRNDYNPDNFDESEAVNYGGYITRDSRFPPKIIPTHQIRRSVPMENYGPNEYMARPSVFSRVDVQPYNEGMGMARTIYNQRSGGMSNKPGVSDLMNGVIRMGSGNEQHVSRVSVPANLVHGILGMDGRRLSDIIRDSGAAIDIQPDRMSNDTIFALRGSPDQIYQAQCLMQLCVRKFNDEDHF